MSTLLCSNAQFCLYSCIGECSFTHICICMLHSCLSTYIRDSLFQSVDALARITAEGLQDRVDRHCSLPRLVKAVFFLSLNRVPFFRQQMFSHPSQRRASEISSSYIALRTAARQLWEGLHEVLRVLLKNAQLRERVLQLLAAFINDNALRSQLQVSLIPLLGCFPVMAGQPLCFSNFPCSYCRSSERSMQQS